MAKQKKYEYTCTIEYTEGWQQRVTDALVSLYYQRLRQGKGQPKDKERASA